MSDDEPIPTQPLAEPSSGPAGQPTADPTGGADLARDLLARARADAGSATAARSRRTGRWATPDRPTSAEGRDPQLLGSLVDGLVAERGWASSVAVGGVEGRWATVVGADLAGHCLPETYQDGVLTVRAESTAWATQVRLLAPVLVARLNADLGDGTVTRVTVLGPDGPSWKKGKLRVKGRGPRDTYG